MIARAFTNVHKHSVSACTSSLRQPALVQHNVPPLSNFKGAAKRTAAANFESCQILEAAAIYVVNI